MTPGVLREVRPAHPPARAGEDPLFVHSPRVSGQRLSEVSHTVVVPTTEERPVCDLCDQPDRTTDDVEDRIREVIKRRRFAMVSVAGSSRTAEFSYTVGLTEHGLPELIVTAVRSDSASRLLDLWGNYLLDTSAVLPGETLESGPWLLEAVHVEQPQDHLLVADRFYGDRLRALQLVWADSAERWPWEPGHRARRSGQPVLGARAPWYCDEHTPNRLDVPPHL